MNKFTRNGLALSALSLAVAVMLLGYSAYGWFSLTREARATGLAVQVTAPTNLQISGDGESFSNSLTVRLNDLVAGMAGNESFNPDTDQFFLNPASSYSGLTMWYTESVSPLGEALCAPDEYRLENRGSNSIAYSVNNDAYEGHYIDVPLWFRSASAELPDVYLLKSQTDVISPDSTEVVKIVRAAFLTGDGTAVAYPGSAALVYQKPGQVHTTPKVVTANGAVSQLVDPPSYLTFGDKFSTVPVFRLTKTQPSDLYATQKIVVRLWIEGQDNKCVGTVGGKSFSFNLGFSLLDE